MEEYSFRSEFNEKWSPLVRKIINLLSQDSRMSLAEMSKQLGVSRRTVMEKMRKAEAEFGIKYTIELNEVALGLNNPHLIMIKFSSKPNYEEVAKILQSSHIPQLAVRTNGKYDMIVYANAENTLDYVHWDKSTQISLSKYGVLWRSSDLAFNNFGFFPERNALIERLSIPKLYKQILLALNENSRVSFAALSKKLGIHFNTAAYNFNKLLSMGYVKRFTMVMTNPPGDIAMMSLFGKFTLNSKFTDDAERMKREVILEDDKDPLVNRCLVSSQLVGSYDSFFLGAYDSLDVGNKKLVKYYRSRFKRHKVNVMNAGMANVIFGALPIRSIEVQKEYNTISWTPKKG